MLVAGDDHSPWAVEAFQVGVAPMNPRVLQRRHHPILPLLLAVVEEVLVPMRWELVALEVWFPTWKVSELHLPPWVEVAC